MRRDSPRDPRSADAREATLARLRRLATLLDSRFRLPGTSWKIGLDGLVGLIPGIGDGATGLLSAYIVVEAWRLGVRKRTLAKMIFNAGIDALLGSIPLLGDLFDLGWKANNKNIDLLFGDLGVPRS